MAKGPVLIELDEAAAMPSVTDAPPVPEVAPADTPALAQAASWAARRPSRLARLFWASLIAFLGAVVSVAAWDFATGLIARNELLGYAVTGLGALVLGLLLLVSLRELAVLGRLRRIDGLRHDAAAALAGRDLTAARNVSERIDRLYATRDHAKWGRARFQDLKGDQVDADSLLALTEREVLAPFDALAEAQVAAAARKVATITALVPLALADVIGALVTNLRMIRAIAEIYGGRSGLWGSWRLTRAVLAHLVATGAVAIGDDLLEPVLGGTILAKLSRRFGEGLVNGALTARVGVAAMEMCRPLAFEARGKQRARDILRRALADMIPGRGTRTQDAPVR